MEIHLEPVTQSNWEACIKLRVSEDQKTFVASNLFSIAQAQFHPGVLPRCAYDGELMIGFVMCGADPDEPDQRWIWRLMVDASHQGHGYGAAILSMVIAEERSMGTARLYLSVEPKNAGAIGLYERFGFTATGVLQDGEEMYVLELTARA